MRFARMELEIQGGCSLGHDKTRYEVWSWDFVAEVSIGQKVRNTWLVAINWVDHREAVQGGIKTMHWEDFSEADNQALRRVSRMVSDYYNQDWQNNPMRKVWGIQVDELVI